MKIRLHTISFIFFAASSLLLPQNKTTLTLKLVPEELPFGLIRYVDAAKPNAAVVLSGGGARGLAHIGVLRALEENNIPIKNVIGTSMGSIIGGLYAAGYSIDEIDSIARKTPWNDFFSAGDMDRREQFYDQKITNDKALFAIRLDGLKPILPTSVSTGQKVSNFLTLLALNAPIKTNSSFKDLLYNFNAVCTDLVTGKRVILNEGSLGFAMRASSSVMFLLSPVEMDSLLLVDGGLVANIPVDVAEDLGSEFIIASDATSPLYKSEELSVPWKVADQLISIPMMQLNKQQLKNADIVVKPADDIRLNSDFDQVDTLISLGYKLTLNDAVSASQKFREKYYKNIEADDKIYSNFKFISSDNEALQHFGNLYNFEKISQKELLYTLGLLSRKGCYKSLALEINEAETVTISIITIKNPIVKNVNVIGGSFLSDSLISQTINSIIEKPFNSNKILKAALNLIQHYRDEGELLANIESVSYNEEEGTVTINIDEKIIHKIVVSGNKKTNEDVILREFPVNENDYLNIEKLKTGLVNLRATDLFESVDVKIISINNINELNIIVDEKISSLVRFGLRIDDEDFTQVSLDIRDENVFGTGTELGGILFYGARKKSLMFEHRSNRIFDTYLTYKLRGYFKLDDVNVYTNVPSSSQNRIRREKIAEYRQLYLGGSFGVGSQFQRFGNIFIETKYEKNEIKNKFDFPADKTFKEDLATVKFSISIDSQNKFPYPTFGSRVNAFYETGLSVFNAATGFTKFYFDYIGYFSIGSNHTLAPKFVLGFADETLPLSQQFSLGGQQNFFGLREDEFRGRQVFKTSLEYQFVTPFKLFFDTFFRLRYDLGSIWSVREEIRLKDLRHGIGLTLSLDTPIGPADFSVGRSFIIERSLPDNVIKWGDTIFYFTIGYYY